MQTQTQTQTQTQPSSAGTLKLRGDATSPLTSAYPELDANGFAVIRNVISREKADAYVNEMYKWAESFGLGFKVNDRSTWRVANMPLFYHGGLFNRHAVGQEQWAWDIRSEPALIDIFSKIWGTDELLVSVDAVNFSLPYPKGEADSHKAAWPHVDQSPNRRFKHCIQGMMNLLPNGPTDGGLAVLEGSFKLYNKFFEEHSNEMPENGWDWKDSFPFTEKHMEWFYERGCKWKKVEAEPGDVILWDSRCVHYGAAPEGEAIRAAVYVCYKPAKDITPEFVERRKNIMDELAMTSHDPLLFRYVGPKGGAPPIPGERMRPLTEPVLSDRAKQLAGITSY